MVPLTKVSELGKGVGSGVASVVHDSGTAGAVETASSERWAVLTAWDTEAPVLKRGMTMPMVRSNKGREVNEYGSHYI